MKKTIILFSFLAHFLSYCQEKVYNFPIVDGSKLMSMEQTNLLVQETSRLVANKLVNNSKYGKYYSPVFLFVSGILLHPITHEEGHRSVLTNLGIGSISQPIIDKRGVANCRSNRPNS